MAKIAWSSPLDNSSNTGFRAWGSELSNNFSAVGLVNHTADTGQINWATANVPASSGVYAGYEIWKFNDSLQSTSPIYMKVEYGTYGYSATSPSLRISVSNGWANNGNLLTSTVNTAPYMLSSSAPPSSTTQSYISYMTYNNGFFGLSWKSNYYSASTGNWFLICRTSDQTTQAYTAIGAAIYSAKYDYYSSYNTPIYSWMTYSPSASNAVFSTIQSWSGCLVPGAPPSTSTPYNISNKTFPHWIAAPTALSQLIGMCAVNANEMPAGTTFTTTLFGSTPRTYLVLPKIGSSGFSEASSNANYTIAMLWE